MSLTRSMSIAAVMLAMSLAPAMVYAQSLEEMVRNSNWDSRYTADGQRIRALVEFRGGRGSYDIMDSRGNVLATGQLSQLQYLVNGPNDLLITGNWRLDGEGGFFQLEVDGNNPDSFTGAWNSDGAQRGGSWTGTRINRRPQPQQNNGPNVGAAQGRVTYGRWSRTQRGNYTRTCTLPNGGVQYLILFVEKPEWVYWYNPSTQKYWCACPTTMHPDYGDQIERGVDLFLMADVKASSIEETEFPRDAGANFVRGATAKDNNGANVNLGCPPTDLPPGI